MSKELDGKLALITGASRGIGAATAFKLSREGAHVILVARNASDLEAVDDQIQAAGGAPATLVPMDLTKLGEIDKLCASVAERFGKLDILIGNAGMLGTLSPLSHIAKTKEWEQVFALNVHANMRLIRGLDPMLQRAEAGRAVFISSSTVDRPRAYWAAYRSSKAALEMMARIYADEVANSNLRVNIVKPGAVAGKMLESAYPGGFQDGAVLQPENVAAEIVKLCLPSCDQNGEIVAIEA